MLSDGHRSVLRAAYPASFALHRSKRAADTFFPLPPRQQFGTTGFGF
jgi:hypothetical protein